MKSSARRARAQEYLGVSVYPRNDKGQSFRRQPLGPDDSGETPLGHTLDELKRVADKYVKAMGDKAVDFSYKDLK